MLFPNEDAYDGVIVPIARQYGVPAGLVKAVIAHESRFVPTAIRGEPHLGDASRGLMQLLSRTARDELGFTGDVDALLEPGVNIPLGVRYLALQRSRAGGEWAAAVSAYNGGYRPDIGFGRRATRPLRICLRRNAAGACTLLRDVPVGEFANQPYVDAVLEYWDAYRGLEAAPVPPPAAAPRGGGGCALALGLVGLGLLLA